MLEINPANEMARRNLAEIEKRMQEAGDKQRE
jgi:hypothetical protein